MTWRRGGIIVPEVRLRAFEANVKYYSDIFSNGSKDYAIRRDSQVGPW
jgi:hypothetical protein